MRMLPEIEDRRHRARDVGKLFAQAAQLFDVDQPVNLTQPPAAAIGSGLLHFQPTHDSRTRRLATALQSKRGVGSDEEPGGRKSRGVAVALPISKRTARLISAAAAAKL